MYNFARKKFKKINFLNDRGLLFKVAYWHIYLDPVPAYDFERPRTSHICGALGHILHPYSRLVLILLYVK